jgi:hypothetical protein
LTASWCLGSTATSTGNSPPDYAGDYTAIVDRIGQAPATHASVISGGMPLGGSMSITAVEVPGKTSTWRPQCQHPRRVARLPQAWASNCSRAATRSNRRRDGVSVVPSTNPPPDVSSPRRCDRPDAQDEQQDAGTSSVSWATY